MNEVLYYIEDGKGNVIAKDMTMDVATILVIALFEHYYSEDDIAFTIKRQKVKAKEKTKAKAKAKAKVKQAHCSDSLFALARKSLY